MARSQFGPIASRVTRTLVIFIFTITIGCRRNLANE